METRNRRIASMTLLIAALVLFVAWHFMPCFGNPEVGWQIWPDIWRVLRNPEDLGQDPRGAIAIASILNFSLLIVVSPFLTQVWLKSRLAWWFATIFSGLAAAGFWVIFFMFGPTASPHAGDWCVLLAPILNFLGLILARGKPAPTTPEPPF